MATASLGGTLRRVFDRVREADGGDGELLTRYRTVRDQGAFGSLVRRHGPMVLGVCRRVLGDFHAADDAFQATFLVLAKKADAVRPPDRLAPWLYGVAYRTALKARGRAFRRRQVEHEYAAEATARPTPGAAGEAPDLLPLIDEQLNALPEKYRDPLVLCGVQGLNKAEAATRLGLPEGTVSSRLARAREMLRDRLTRRGVVVPAAALAAFFEAESLQAATTPALLEATTATAFGSAATPATVSALSHEVIRSMTLPKLKLLGALALTASLAGGGFGLVALGADEKKPQPAPGDVKKPAADPVKKPVPDGEKPKPAPDREKPVKPGVKKRLMTGQVGAIDAATRTVTLLRMGEGGLREDAVRLADDAKITVDGKDVKLDAVPKGATAELIMLNFAKDGQPATASELSVDASKVVWVVKSADASGVTLLGGGATSKLADRVIKLAPGAKVFVDKKDAKPTDLQAGDVATITLNADGAATAIFVTTRRADGDGEKPAVKPAKFGGKVASVDATARTISLAPKGEGGKEMVLKLTADAKVTIDGKEAKLGDVAKGATATFTLFSAKDGQLREVSEVVVAGLTFAGAVKQIDTASITIGNEKFDRVLKLAAGGKVVSGEKEVKLADLKVGDRVTVTLTSDESAAVLIVVGSAKKADGDKPKGDKSKPEKGEGEEDGQ